MSNPLQTAVLLNQTTAAEPSPAPISFLTLPGPGNSVILSFTQVNGFADGNITAVVDNQTGNTFVQVVAAKVANESGASVWWCPSITAPSGTYTVTVTYTGTYGTYCLGLMECSGLSAVDQTGFTNTGAAATTRTVTAGGANATATDFVIAGFGAANFSVSGLSTPSGFTPLFNNTVNMVQQFVYKTCAAIETSAATWTWTSSQNGDTSVIASFTGAAAPPPAGAVSPRTLYIMP